MKNKPPKHVAIIMDGNGRWAKEKKVPLIHGHKKGVDVAFEISKAAPGLGVEWLTLYTFSTENFKRPQSWLFDFTKLLNWYLENEAKKIIDYNVKLHTIGNYKAFGKDISNKLDHLMDLSSNNTGLNLVLALNYGSREEIRQAFQTIAEKVKQGDLEPCDIDDEMIRQHLFTKDIPDPDLMIRTSGEKRLSNYLLWQMAYSEFSFSPKYWPDYTVEDFKESILCFQNRERRYGEYIDSPE